MEMFLARHPAGRYPTAFGWKNRFIEPTYVHTVDFKWP